MNTQHLFPNENVLLTSNDNSVTLTNRRIFKYTSTFSSSYLVSIHLEKISSIEVRYKSWRIILILGAILLVASIYGASQNVNNEIMIAFFIAGIICVLIYLITRRHLISVSSDGGAKLNILTRGMSKENVINFIKKIEEAKAVR